MNRPAGRVLIGVIAGLIIAGLAAGISLLATSGGTRQQPPFFGVALPDANLDRLTSFTSKTACSPTVFSEFVKLDSPSFSLAGLQKISAAGMTPFLTLEPWSYQSKQGDASEPQYSLRSIVDGAHDKELRAIGDVLARYGKPVYLRFAHEMNAPWYPWGTGDGNTAAEYKAAWRHVHALLKPKAPAAKWVWAPAAVQQVKDGPKLASLYPGDDVVDFVGMTGYAKPGNGETSAAQTFGQTLTVLHAFTNKPLLLAEAGADGARKTSWLASLGDFLHSHRDVRGLVYFNTSPESTGATGSYQLTSKAQFDALHDSLTRAGACAS